MNLQKLSVLITAFTIFTFAGCGGGGANNTANVGNTSVNSVNTANTANANSPLATTRTPEAATTNNAPTLAPVVQAYYDALKKKDNAAMKKVLSAEMIKSLEADAKDDKKSSMIESMAANEAVPAKPVEVRNEKIEGDKASAELKGGVYINWTKLNFVKEGGAWKFTNQFDDFDSVKASANSNSAK